jgi:hypothetical protein
MENLSIKALDAAGVFGFSHNVGSKSDDANSASARIKAGTQKGEKKSKSTQEVDEIFVDLDGV